MIDEGYKPATIARELVVLKAIFNRAIKNEHIEKNPIARVSAPKFDNTVVRYLTPDQEERLFFALPERLHPIVTVALHTGLRQGELLKLNWEDVDFNAGTLFVRDRKSGESTHVLMNTRVLDVTVHCGNKRILRERSLPTRWGDGWMVGTYGAISNRPLSKPD